MNRPEPTASRLSRFLNTLRDHEDLEAEHRAERALRGLYGVRVQLHEAYVDCA